MRASDSLTGFGNSLEAHRSVVTAICCFAGSPDCYTEVISRAIGQGNDVDTLAAMAGAISGARVGIKAIPPHLVESLENGAKGRTYIAELADELHQAYESRQRDEANRLRELSRGASRHGSCGHGIGETRNYWLRHGQDAVFAADLKDREALAGKMELLRQRVLLEAQELVDRVPADDHWRLDVLMEPAGQIVGELRQMAEPLTIQATLPACTTAIFEGAQGVLLDEWRGFHPHTTWSTVTLHHALAIVEESEAEEICTLGVTRAYMTRHGAGPLPTWSGELDAKLSDPGNPTNSWQGTIRRGWLDMLLLRYAAEAAGGPLDGLVIDCLDHLADVSPQICMSYRCSPDAKIEQLPVSPVPWLAAQERLTALLERAEPICRHFSPAALCDTLACTVAPIAITGDGPTWQDRTLRELRFRSQVKEQQLPPDHIVGHQDRAPVLR